MKASDHKSPPEKAWHNVAIEDALQNFGVDAERGLSEDQIDRQRRRFGPNRLPERQRPGLFALFIRQFRNPLIYILLLAVVVSAALANWSDALFILFILLANSALGTYQEWKAESGAAALEKAMESSAKVLRAGERREIGREEVVPGDLLLLESGDLVPADLRLISTSELRIDESLLTGESVPVDKDEHARLEEQTPLADRRNMAFAGSLVVSGRAEGVVCATGADSEVGRIARSLSEKEQQPPLVLRLQRFTRSVALIVAGAVVLIAIGQMFRGAALTDVFFLAVALAVAAIPEALPVAITVALSVSSNRMAARHVIVRRLPAVEGLGACTLIATDKTGTLTEGSLTVRRLYVPEHGELGIGGDARSREGPLTRDAEPADEESAGLVDRLVRAGALCNEGQLRQDENERLTAQGDPVDAAFLVLAAKRGMMQEELQRKYPQAGIIPYESQRKYAASFIRDDQRVIAHVKGALEVILPMSSRSSSVFPAVSWEWLTIWNPTRSAWC